MIDLDEVKDMHIVEERRRRFTLKDVLLILAIAVNPIVWWVKVDGHLNDPTIHPTREQREEFVDERIDMKLGNRYAEFRSEVLAELADIKKGVAETNTRIARVEGQITHGR